jgi:hypothetical protein
MVVRGELVAMAPVVAVVSEAGQAKELCVLLDVDPAGVDEFVVADEESLDALQDIVYGQGIESILLPALDTLPCDPMSQQMMLSGWRGRGVDVRLAVEEPGDDGRLAASALDEVNAYGHIPWVP